MSFVGPIPNLCDAEAVLFDWDGVIAQTSLDFAPVRKKYFDGRRVMLLEEANTLAPDVRKSLMADLDDLEKEGAKNATPIDGARKMIDLLENRGVPWAVVSRNSLASIEIAAQKIGVPLPQVVCARDNAAHTKPDPRALTDAASRLGVQPKETFFVGDFLYDMIGARRAAIRGVLVERMDDAWRPWKEIFYESVADLYDALARGGEQADFVPWEYAHFAETNRIGQLKKKFSQSIQIKDAAKLSVQDILEACHRGYGRVVAPRSELTPEQWRRNPELPPEFMGRGMADAVREFLVCRYPLVTVEDA